MVLISFLGLSNGKLKVNAGYDFTLCKSIKGIDTTRIGDIPTAIGGTEPYSYCWMTTYSNGLDVFYASDFLDDTTLANPNLIKAPDDSLKLKLVVTDKNGFQAIDIVTIHFSTFQYSKQVKEATVIQDEKIRLWTDITGGLPPLTYSWTPDEFVNDASIRHPIAVSMYDVIFTVVAIDTFGCVSEPDTLRLYVKALPID